MATFELYRGSSIGKALTETLNEMVEGNILSPDLAMEVLLSFDRSIAEFLARQVRPKITFKGHLHTYRICFGVCTFIVQDAQIATDEGLQTVDWLKIVACDSNLLSHKEDAQTGKRKRR